MRLTSIAVRGFRNLADGAFELPATGVVLLGPNGHGKTSFLEALYYPALFRSLRDATEAQVVRFGAEGFAVEAVVRPAEGREQRIRVSFRAVQRRKRVEIDGAVPLRSVDHVGTWLAVGFLPADVQLAGGSAEERRRFVDRMLALAQPGYLRALARYRHALLQRNGALRQRRPDVARAFDGPLAEAGAAVVAARVAWAAAAAGRFAAEFAWLGERWHGSLQYRGRDDLADAAAWPAALEGARAVDAARGMTTVGPHRDDLVLLCDGRPLRTFGSTGQQRSAAVALKLVELDTLAAARGDRPAFLLDDVFAELDGERQRQLARRLADGGHQVFLSAARADEVPRELGLPTWRVAEGVVRR